MYNELLHIGPVTIYGYGLMIAIGIIAAYFTAEYRAKKAGYDSEPIFYIVLYGVAFGFLGAKLLYFITILDRIVVDPSLLKTELTNGFVVYGGLITGILAAAIYCKIKKLPFLTYLDLSIPSVPLAQGFGRIGCFLAGCCYGIPTDSAFSVTFTHSAYAPNNIALFPSQLVSSGLNFIHFILLCCLSRKLKHPGQLVACFLIFYSIGRFGIEFFRGDYGRGSVGVLSTSQFIAIFTLLFGVAMFVLLARCPKADTDN